MPVEAPDAPAGIDVSIVKPETATMKRDAGRPSRAEKLPPSKASKEAREKAQAIAKEMSAKKFLLGDNTPAEPVAAVESKEEASKVTPATDDKPKEKPAAEPTAEEKASAVAKAKRVRVAKNALILDGWEAEEVEEMFAKDEAKAIARGEHRAKNQADVNRNFDALKKAATSPTGARNEDGTFAKPADSKADTTTTPPPSKEVASDAKKTPEAPVYTGLKGIDAEIEAASEDLGEPAVKLLKKLSGAFKAEIEQARTEASAAGTTMSREVLNMKILDRIGDLHPGELEKVGPQRFDEVVETLKMYLGSGRFVAGELHKAIDSAIYTEFGPSDKVRKAQRDALARQHAADKGRVDPGHGDKGSEAATSASPKTGKEKLQLAAALFAKNPNANLDALHSELMGRLRSPRAA